MLVEGFIVGGALYAMVKAMGGKLVETVDASGVCQTDPEKIAAAHGVSLDVEALARMAVKEAGASEKTQIAVMWAARNMAKSRGESVAKLLLRGRLKSGGPSSSDGKFGSQNTGKYAATPLPSTPAARALAAKVLAGSIPDPTGGATQFDAPKAQSALKANKTAGYEKSPEEIAEERSRGSTLVMVPGITSTRFWVPKGKGVA